MTHALIPLCYYVNLIDSFSAEHRPGVTHPMACPCAMLAVLALRSTGCDARRVTTALASTNSKRINTALAAMKFGPTDFEELVRQLDCCVVNPTVAATNVGTASMRMLPLIQQ